MNHLPPIHLQNHLPQADHRDNQRIRPVLSPFCRRMPRSCNLPRTATPPPRLFAFSLHWGSEKHADCIANFRLRAPSRNTGRYGARVPSVQAGNFAATANKKAHILYRNVCLLNVVCISHRAANLYPSPSSLPQSRPSLSQIAVPVHQNTGDCKHGKCESHQRPDDLCPKAP